MFKTTRRFLLAAAIAAASLGGQGCARNAGSLDRAEERDPLVRRALGKKNIEDADGAIELFNKALDRRPTLARAHLELGLLYSTHKQDYIRAVYHYQRYLELRPQTEKKALIEGLIRQAKLAYAASLPFQPSGAVEEIAALKREIQVLKGQLAQSGAASAAPAGPSKPAPAPGLQPPKPAPAQPAVETYVVQPRDTLSSIAAKVYNDRNKWKQIYEANRSTLASPESVKAGQTLIIPR